MLSGYLCGSFDLFNVGDLDVIAQARARCERLVVGVLSDEAVERRHGRPPVVPFEERAAILRHVRGVDEVVLHAGEPAQDTDVVFAAAVDAAVDDVPLTDLGAVVSLQVLRSTTSPTLLDALRPLPQSSVA